MCSFHITGEHGKPAELAEGGGNIVRQLKPPGDGQRLVELTYCSEKVGTPLGHRTEQQMRPALERLVTNAAREGQYLSAHPFDQIYLTSADPACGGDEVRARHPEVVPGRLHGASGLGQQAGRSLVLASRP
jgi:hypothetical protein